MQHQLAYKIIIIIYFILKSSNMFSQIDIPEEAYIQIDHELVLGDKIDVDLFNNFIKEYPKSSYLNAMYVYYLFFNHDIGIAEERLNKFLSEVPHQDNSYVLLVEGLLAQASGSNDKAIEFYNASIRQDAEDKNKWARFELALLKNDSFSEKKKLLEEALRIDNRFLPAELELSNSYKDIGERGIALEILQNSVLLNELNTINYHIGLLYLEQQNYSDAEKAFNRSNAIKENANAYIGLGFIDQSYYGKFENALSQYFKAVELDSTNATAHKRIGILYLESGQPEKAISFLKESVELEPEIVDNRLELIYSLVLTKNYPEARIALTEANYIFGNYIKEIDFWNILILTIDGEKKLAQKFVDAFYEKYSSAEIDWLKNELKSWGVEIK